MSVRVKDRRESFIANDSAAAQQCRRCARSASGVKGRDGRYLARCGVKGDKHVRLVDRNGDAGHEEAISVACALNRVCVNLVNGGIPPTPVLGSSVIVALDGVCATNPINPPNAPPF
jgi:hypothetical protein